MQNNNQRYFRRTVQNWPFVYRNGHSDPTQKASSDTDCCFAGSGVRFYIPDTLTKQYMKNIAQEEVQNASFQKQIDEYGKLKITQTYRGKSQIILWVSIALVIASSIFSNNLTTILATIVGQFISFGLLSIYIGKGKNWAIITTQILWTLGAIREMATYLSGIQQQRDVVSGDLTILLIGAVIYFFTMRIFVLALRVEKTRKKTK